MAHTKPLGPIWIDFKSLKNGNVLARSYKTKQSFTFNSGIDVPIYPTSIISDSP